MRSWPALLKSKTFWGAVLGAGSYLLGQESINITQIFTAIGAVVTAAGIKDNFVKVEKGNVDPPRGEGTGDYEKDRI